MASKRKMEADVDHYAVLGLPSGEEGARLSEKEIAKAYRLKALLLHPDKSPHDPNAHANFQMLRASYDILKDQKSRKAFDDLLRAKYQRESKRVSKGQWKVLDLEEECQKQREIKRQRMMSEFEERVQDLINLTRTREEEEMITKKILEQFVKIHAMYATKTPGTMLLVMWDEKICGQDYSGESLKKILGRFGRVNSVKYHPKMKGMAIVLMGSQEGARAAASSLISGLSISRLGPEPIY